jgi:hypothetical protein
MNKLLFGNRAEVDCAHLKNAYLKFRPILFGKVKNVNKDVPVYAMTTAEWVLL